MRTAAACAIKELIINHYDLKDGSFTLAEDDKLKFKNSIFDLFAKVQTTRVLR